MKLRSMLPVLLLGFVASAPVPPKISGHIQGDYLEARTASVFAGACHYNGELVTEGRQAILSWHVSQGSWKGVDLSGVTAMAQVVSDENLGDDQAARKNELVVSSNATDKQAAAFSDFVRTNDSLAMGETVSVRQVNISFQHDAVEYVVKADGFAAISVRPMPNNECCSQPHLVWYNPMMPLEHRKVGYTETASYTSGTLGDIWARADENSAFYGTFNIVTK